MSLPEPWSAREFPAVAVVARGRISEVDADHVARAVGRLLDRRGISGGARLRLTGRSGDDAALLVQVNLRVGDLPARMQTVMAETDDLLVAIARLNRQIGWAAAPWRPRPWPDRTRRMLAAPGDAVITRRKAYVLQRTTPMQAVAVMDAMDYDVHLFIDAETEEDAVVYRGGPSGLRLARQRRMHPPASEEPVPLIVNPLPVPTLTEAEAVGRARGHGLPFLFFTDPATGRGRLLYTRYDGNLGLISPASDPIGDDPR